MIAGLIGQLIHTICGLISSLRLVTRTIQLQSDNYFIIPHHDDYPRKSFK